MDDERLAQIEAERQQMQSKNDSMYNDLLQDNENLYNQQKEYANTWEQTTNNNLDKQLEFNTNLINQQKDKATNAYETETKKAKNDFTAYTNPYGLQAEQFASQGLLKSGVAETAKLGGYNSYQNRLAAANKTWQDAITQYDNDINQARLTNDVQKAENAVKKLEMNLQYTNSYFNNKSSLKQNQFSNSLSIGGDYFNRYNTVYNNIQAEKERQEAIRQYQEQFEYKKQQDALAQQNWEKEYALSRSTANARYGSGSGYNYALTDGTSTNVQNNAFGNSQDTINKSDYYFKASSGEDYQPRYIDNTKLSKTGVTSKQLGLQGVGDNKNIWKANDKYYVWNKDTYYDVTDEYNSLKKK